MVERSVVVAEGAAAISTLLQAAAKTESTSTSRRRRHHTTASVGRRRGRPNTLMGEAKNGTDRLAGPTKESHRSVSLLTQAALRLLYRVLQ